MYISSVTDFVHVPIFISPRVSKYAEQAGFASNVEAAIFEKTGISSSIRDDTYLDIYSDCTKTELIETISLEDNKLITSGWYKGEVSFAREFMIQLPKSLVAYAFKHLKRDALFYRKYEAGASHKNLANTLFTFTLTHPLVTSEGLKFYSVSNYFQAMKTLDSEKREVISLRDSKEVCNYWNNLPSSVQKKYIRPDFNSSLGASILFYAFKYAWENDLGFAALLKASSYAPLVYYTDSKDMLFTYGVSKSSFFGKDYIGKILTYIKYSKWLKNILE